MYMYFQTVEIHLQSKFLEVGLLDQNINISSLEIAKFPSIRGCHPTLSLAVYGNAWFFFCLTNKACCPALKFLPLICIFLTSELECFSICLMTILNLFLVSYVSCLLPIVLSNFCYHPSLTYEVTDPEKRSVPRLHMQELLELKLATDHIWRKLHERCLVVLLDL